MALIFVDSGQKVAQLEMVDDVSADPAGRSGSEGHHGQIGQEVAEAGDLPVFRAEIVAPLGDAVGLVNREG